MPAGVKLSRPVGEKSVEPVGEVALASISTVRGKTNLKFPCLGVEFLC